MNLSDIDWPLFGLDDGVRPELARLLEGGQAAVMATLFAADGGSPRGVGAQMLFGEHAVTGYLSGGCVEADVALHADAVIGDGRPRRLVYGEGGPADVRLPCGGRIEMLLERIPPEDEAARALLSAWRERRPALWLSDGEVRACLAPGDGAESLAPPLRAAFSAALDGGVCGAAGATLAIFRRFDPSWKLAVIGRDPPALAMAALGAQVGFETALVRPKGPAIPPPIQGCAYHRDSPAEALARVGLDAWTAAAVASHDADVDEEALAAALASPAGYIGLLGSRRRLPERLAALRARGFGEADLQRIRAPIGLPLAGKAPWEIALAVIGEIVQTRRERERVEAWPPPPGLHAVVLAAGEGSRYGGSKLLADWRGRPVLHGALAAAFAAPAATVTLVTGANAAAVAASARAFAETRPDGARLRIVHAQDYGQGLSASLKRGITALPHDAEGAFLFLGDMPDVPTAVLGPLARALAGGAQAAAPTFGARRGHPVLVSRALFAALMTLEGDRGAGVLLEALGPALALVPAPDDGTLFDVDVPADLDRAAG